MRIQLFLLLLLTTQTYGQSTILTWDAPSSCGGSTFGKTRPRLGLNAADEPVVLWGRTSPAANFASVRTGGMFTSPAMVTPAGVMPAVDVWMGSELAIGGNDAYVVFKRSPESNGAIYLVHSGDGGFTWEDTLRVDPLDGTWSRFANVAVGPMSGPLVQYMQFDSGFVNARYVVSRMNDGQFLPPVQASAPFSPGDVCDCCPGQIVADGQRACALYRNNGSNIRVIWGAGSIDGAASFAGGNAIDGTGWVLNACPSSGPDGFISGDSITAVWMSGAQNGAKVYIRRAHLPDMSGNTMYGVHEGQGFSVQQNYPRIAGNGDTLGVVWEQIVNGMHNVLFAWSTNGVAGLSEPDTVNINLAGGARNPDIAYANGSFHIVWQDDDDLVVGYRRASLSSTVGIQGDGVHQQPRLTASPVPSAEVVTLSGGGVKFAGAVVHIHDASGCILVQQHLQDGHVSLSGLPEGVYTLRVLGCSGDDLGVVRVVKVD